jgi:hypothetical protein
MISFVQSRLTLGKNHLIIGPRRCGKTTLVRGLLGTIVKHLPDIPVIVIVFDSGGYKGSEYRGITPYIVGVDTDMDKMLSLITTNSHLRERYHKVIIYEDHDEPDSAISKDLILYSELYNVTNIVIRDTHFTMTENMKTLFPHFHQHFIFNIKPFEIHKTLYARLGNGIATVPIHTFSTYLRILSKDDYEYLIVDTSASSSGSLMPLIRFSRMRKPRSVAGVFFTSIPEFKEVLHPSKTPKAVSFSPCDRISVFFKNHQSQITESPLPAVQVHHTQDPEHPSSAHLPHSSSSTSLQPHPPLSSPRKPTSSFTRPENVRSNVPSKSLIDYSPTIPNIPPLQLPVFTPAPAPTTSTNPPPSIITSLPTTLEDSLFTSPKYPTFETQPLYSTNPFDDNIYDMLEHLKDAVRSIQKAQLILESAITSSP